MNNGTDHQGRLDVPTADALRGAAPPGNAFVDVNERDGVLRVKLHGPKLAQREVPIVERELNAHLDRLGKRLRTVVIDASQIELMCSLGLGMCIDCRNRARTIGAPTIIFGLNDRLAGLFRMTHVDRLFTLVDSSAALEQALAA